MQKVDSQFFERLAARTFDLLLERKALVSNRTAFWVWPRDDRAVIVFDPAAIMLDRVDDKFAHLLSTRLYGRRVVRTNSRGMFLQVGYGLPSLPAPLSEQPLELDKQPTPLSLPVGITKRGVLWIPLLEGVSFLVSGSTGMGKTGLVHAWIQALLHGGQARVYAWDGKGGTEYLRYAGRENFEMIGDLRQVLSKLLIEAERRRAMLLQSGATNVSEFNTLGGETLQPIALVIDEARLVDESLRPMISQIVERERATGICPVLCTNNPVQADILVKGNLITRVCFPVPSWNASQMALGMTGAEKLPKLRGRGLMAWKANVIEFQSFRVMYPKPSEEQVEAYQTQADSTETAEADAPAEPSTMNETKRILELHAQGKSAHAIVGELYQLTSGRRYMRRLADVKAITSTSATSTPLFVPQMGVI